MRGRIDRRLSLSSSTCLPSASMTEPRARRPRGARPDGPVCAALRSGFAGFSAAGAAARLRAGLTGAAALPSDAGSAGRRGRFDGRICGRRLGSGRLGARACRLLGLDLLAARPSSARPSSARPWLWLRPGSSAPRHRPSSKASWRRRLAGRLGGRFGACGVGRHVCLVLLVGHDQLPLTMTTEFLAPGTAPLMSSRLFSGSRATTRKPELRDARVAHVTGHALALEDPARDRRWRRSSRAGGCCANRETRDRERSCAA